MGARNGTLPSGCSAEPAALDIFLIGGSTLWGTFYATIPAASSSGELVNVHFTDPENDYSLMMECQADGTFRTAATHANQRLTWSLSIDSVTCPVAGVSPSRCSFVAGAGIYTGSTFYVDIKDF